MNQLFLLILTAAMLSACAGKPNSGGSLALIAGQSSDGNQGIAADTLRVDLQQANLHWKGTKMRGLGKHEGEIQLLRAYFLTHAGEITGGGFTADMSTIAVTDIPEHEPVPRRNLNNHLKSEDFFDVANFPTSHFVIEHVNLLSADSIQVSGKLHIKGISQDISFRAATSPKSFSTTFTFDRFLWNIAYEGSWIDRTFVDKDIELSIQLPIQASNQ